MKTLRAALLAAPLAAVSVHAQTTAPPSYNPLETFAPLTLPNPVNSYRSSDGAPGPMYWQNKVDYKLDATLDTAAKTLTTSELITYKNNSPDTLTSLWLNLEQNTYRADSRAHAFMPEAYRRYFGDHHTDGYILDSVEIAPTNTQSWTKAVTVVSDTRLQIQLPEDLAIHHGASLAIRIHYHYTIPGEWGGRTSWGTAKQGEIYDLAQWYPRLCVYDDLHGWDTQPYLANEFYLEYGDFAYNITVPSNFIVAGSGELANPDQVLTKAELARLDEARHSDKTVFIRTAEEAATAVKLHPTTTKTWRFVMHNTRDVSWTASATFLWDAARMNIPETERNIPGTTLTRPQLAQSVYPAESAGDEAWGRSTEYLKDAVEDFSRRWFPYPWPNAINVAGPTSGMEYPGIIFDGIHDHGKELFWVTAHEIGHSWFPMIVGSNERRDAWIDEGFNTFIDIYESDDFHHGEYAPKRDGEYAPGGGYPADEIAKVIADPAAPVILSRADAIQEKYRHPITYFKSAEGLVLLREDILGPQRFDFAFRKYIRDWAFKHPSPSDFFRAMESSGGEDLSYFWRGWYMHNWQLDLAITSVSYVDKADPTKGLEVRVANNGQLVLPATLRIEQADKTHVDVAVPIETWMLGPTHTFTVPLTGAATSATIDPDHTLPDSERSNNSLAIQ